MSLLTTQEQQAAWNGLLYGISNPLDRNLAHTMTIRHEMLSKVKVHTPENYAASEMGYCMVERGVIRTTAQFNRIVKQLLRR